jgi:hypothetical protein
MLRSDVRSIRSRRALTTVACGALMAACGGGGASTTSTPASASPGTASQSAPEEFGLSLAELAARIEETERLIAQCMTGAGFQYVALDFVSVKEAMGSDQTAPGVSDEDYIKQYGLGVTTQFDKPLITFGAGPENTAYVDGLPEPDQVAFRRSLWGEATGWNHARALEEEDFSETGGCTRSAAEQTYSSTELSGSYINPADILFEQDPRMIAAIKEWSDCMRADGYEYDHPDQVDDDLRERLDAITQGQDPKTITGPALDALHELQGEELTVAALLTTCEEDHIEPVQAQLESELYGAPQS